MAAAVLDRFRSRPVDREHRVCRPVPFDVLLNNGGFQPLVATLAAQVFELAVEIEHERRVGQASSWPGCPRMEPDNVKRLAAHAHAERGILGVGAYGGVPFMGPCVRLVDALQSCKQESLKDRFRHDGVIREMDDKTPEGIFRLVARSKRRNACRQPVIVCRTRERGCKQVTHQVAAMGRSAGKAGKGVALKKGIEFT